MNAPPTPKTYRKLHPHKFLMWLAIGSIVMMFAGFTSAYIVQKSQQNWYDVPLPRWFYLSTIMIVSSSVMIILAKQFFKKQQYVRFKQLLLLAFGFGLLFVIFQYLGFKDLNARGLFIAGDNVASSFLYVIVGLHALHVIGGLCAFIFVIKQQFAKRTIYYNSKSADVLAIYWHFVDILWIYLLIFFWVQT